MDNITVTTNSQTAQSEVLSPNTAAQIDQLNNLINVAEDSVVTPVRTTTTSNTGTAHQLPMELRHLLINYNQQLVQQNRMTKNRMVNLFQTKIYVLVPIV